MATLQERRLRYHSRAGLEPGASGFSTLRINHYATRGIVTDTSVRFFWLHSRVLYTHSKSHVHILYVDLKSAENVADDLYPEEDGLRRGAVSQGTIKAYQIQERRPTQVDCDRRDRLGLLRDLNQAG
jgi:hypothetical protein